MDPELKSMLTVLLDKVERIDATVTRVEAEQCEMKEELRQIKDEQRQMKEMLGVVRLKEIGRLDGRIDQLAMDVALGRKPDAA
ncbi:hypothetical protein [Azospirillum sp.]|uniref:hypothetical protein n=1 Tax=Azospirillum sp. TaxID=34012 RepID=UPI002D54A406|nr:hypothetical protein [Azospirillum sp.]HYD68011.1 hypothetical protein [Azospirillum sp.]